MDRCYKEDIPKYKKVLESLREEFSGLDSRSDWNALRIDPLLRHVDGLERLLHSPQFKSERSRLSRGVAMFRADLVYLRTNIKELKAVLVVERARAGRAKRPKVSE